jgi:hypothetical protein
MPMVGHDAVREQPHADAFHGLGGDTQERGVIAILGEDERPRLGAIEDVIDAAAPQRPAHDVKA